MLPASYAIFYNLTLHHQLQQQFLIFLNNFLTLVIYSPITTEGLQDVVTQRILPLFVVQKTTMALFLTPWQFL